MVIDAGILDIVMVGIAQYLIVLSLLVYIWYFIWTKEKKRLIFYTLTIAIVAGVLALMAGAVYYNPRPFVVEKTIPLFPHPADNGFPSDHVLLASVIAMSLLPFSRRYCIILWIIALIIGVARAYSGVHYPIDIIASVIIALVSYGLSFYFWKRLKAIK